MLSGEFYHGTSSIRLEHIRADGFKLNEDWSKWLSAKGVYFVLNRPLVALFYARQAALHDSGRYSPVEPVVIKVSINFYNETRILDLTSENGMHILFNKYYLVRSKFGSISDFLSVNDKIIRAIWSNTQFSEKEKSDFILSLCRRLRRYSEFKWDCAVITDLVNENGYAAIIAVFQEGLSGAFDCFEYKYHDESTPSYQGIRYRDAIVVCITDLDWIDKSFIEVNLDNYPKAYLNKVSNIENNGI